MAPTHYQQGEVWESTLHDESLPASHHHPGSRASSPGGLSYTGSLDAWDPAHAPEWRDPPPATLSEVPGDVVPYLPRP